MGAPKRPLYHMTIRGTKSVDGEDRVITNSDEFTATQVTVATTPTLIAAANPNRKFLEISNNGGATVFIGGATVTTTTGHGVITTGKFTMLSSISTAAIYGIVAASTNVVTVVEF
jgi:hypothetical protein